MGTLSDLKAADGHALKAYLAEPAERPRGGIIVVQEIFGVNSHIRAVTDGYAAEGYLAIAPSLFDRVRRDFECGYTQTEIQTGLALMRQVTWDEAMKDVAAAVESVSHCGKIGIVGFCWGGAVTWLAAARIAGLAAAVGYYGGAIPSLAGEQPRCPTMLHFGENDTSIPIDKARAVARAHPEVTTHFYPVGHGFNCDQRASYDATAAQQARERTLEFFSRHVG